MDDSYLDDLDDADISAALAAVERSHAQSRQASASASSSKPQPASLRNASNQGAVVQPVPRKITKPSGPSSIIVNINQKGNSILSHIKAVPWEYGAITPDYLVGATTCILFLSLKYHRLHPEYIYKRITQLGHTFTLRILLVVVDTDQHSDALKELTKTSLVNNITIILAWSAAEAGRYVETFKVMEHAPPTIIKERQRTDYMSRVEDMATSVRSVNKTDAMSMITMFGSVKAAVNANEAQLGLIAGWGEKKITRWCGAVRGPFVTGRGSKSEKLAEVGVKPLNAGKVNEAERAAMNARMGIVGRGKAAEVGKGTVDDAIDIDEDEEAAMYEMELELARKRKIPQAAAPAVPQQAVPVAPVPAAGTGESSNADVQDGVMAALARLRKQ